MLSKNDIKNIIQESKNYAENASNLIAPKLTEIISEEMTKIIARFCHLYENTEDLKNQDLTVVLKLYSISEMLQKEFPKTRISFDIIKDAISKIMEQMNNQGYIVTMSNEHPSFVILKICNWYPEEL